MTRVFQATDLGKKRTKNEDSLMVINQETFVVADGMGGKPAGEVASQILVNTVKVFLLSKPRPWYDKILSEAIEFAHVKIHEAVQEHEEYRGMGTTATILVLDYYKSGCHAHFAHIGDSRIYLLRNENLRQLTEDHSYVEILKQHNELSQIESFADSMKNVLTQSVGMQGKLSINMGNFPAESGDKFLLCTDGLTKMIDDNAILNILLNSNNPADDLINAALDNGGRDNISIIVAEIENFV